MNKRDRRKLYTKLCFSTPQERKKILENKTNRLIAEHNFILPTEKNGFKPSNVVRCRYCDEEIEKKDFEIGHSYWHSYLVTYHKNCKKKGEEKEVFECQKLDADCNDCLYFERGKSIEKDIFEGRCKKYNKQVYAYPNFCSGHKCFKHRKK